MVRLSFGGGSFTGPDAVEANVMEQLAAAERRLGVESEYLTAAGRFAYLLEALHRQTGQRVAVLVDEYDKPILDMLEEPEVARANRDYLRGLYGVIKDNDAHVRFTFLTGISKFSKVNLVDKLFERRVSSVSLGGMIASEDQLSTFDVHHIGTEALLFQTGYLTITEEQEMGGTALYRLGYPNREVRESLNWGLLRHLVQDATQHLANSIRLARLLEAHDCAGLKDLFHAFFASIPYQWYTNNHIADYEGFYASVFYSYFAALGYDVAVGNRAATGAWTWPYAPPATSTCSSSRWPRWRPPVPPSPSCRSAATPTSTAPPASRFTSSASSSAAPPATSPPSS